MCSPIIEFVDEVAFLLPHEIDLIAPLAVQGFTNCEGERPLRVKDPVAQCVQPRDRRKF
jgi:hypothetical protein